MARQDKKKRDFAFDMSVWERYYHQHQSSHIRIRLRIVCLFWEGHSQSEVSRLLNVHPDTVRKYIKRYLSSGYAGLVARDKRKQPTRLTLLQMQSFKEVLLSKRPSEVGLVGHIWTGKLMIAYLEATYGVVYKKGIYELLERLGLSHQRAHADYGNADPLAQQAFVQNLVADIVAEPSTTAIVFGDEFSVRNNPTPHYGWAEKNTRPIVTTNKKRERLNAFLGVEIATTDCFLEAHPTLKADGVALAIYHMAKKLQAWLPKNHLLSRPK